MLITEAQLKQQAQNNDFKRVYFLYGEENYLTHHFAEFLVEKIVNDESLYEFNYKKLDGYTCSLLEISEAVEALPLMAEQKCVTVRDFDVTKLNKDDFNQLKALIGDIPQSCVLVFWTDAIQIDLKKNSKWKSFYSAADKAGAVVCFPHKSYSELARILVHGAARKGCNLTNNNAKLIIQLCGNDLNTLTGELNKLCAYANGGEITREYIEALGVKSLEASVFKLSDAILGCSYERAYDILNDLFAQREQPIIILAVLSNAYADLYRAKVAMSCGVRPESLADDFNYGNSAFRLKNAARDSAKTSISVLRQSLDMLENADRLLKSTGVSDRVALEQTVARLILLQRGSAV